MSDHDKHDPWASLAESLGAKPADEPQARPASQPSRRPAPPKPESRRPAAPPAQPSNQTSNWDDLAGALGLGPAAEPARPAPPPRQPAPPQREQRPIADEAAPTIRFERRSESSAPARSDETRPARFDEDRRPRVSDEAPRGSDEGRGREDDRGEGRRRDDERGEGRSGEDDRGEGRGRRRRGRRGGRGRGRRDGDRPASGDRQASGDRHVSGARHGGEETRADDRGGYEAREPRRREPEFTRSLDERAADARRQAESLDDEDDFGAGLARPVSLDDADERDRPRGSDAEGPDGDRGGEDRPRRRRRRGRRGGRGRSRTGRDGAERLEGPQVERAAGSAGHDDDEPLPAGYGVRPAPRPADSSRADDAGRAPSDAGRAPSDAGRAPGEESRDREGRGRRRRRRGGESRSGSGREASGSGDQGRRRSRRTRSGSGEPRSSTSTFSRGRRDDFAPVAGGFEEDDEGLEFLGVEDAGREPAVRGRDHEEDEVLAESGLNTVLDVPSWIEAIGIVIAGNLDARSRSPRGDEGRRGDDSRSGGRGR